MIPMRCRDDVRSVTAHAVVLDVPKVKTVNPCSTANHASRQCLSCHSQWAAAAEGSR
jgi:hypothetical protein